MRFRVSPLALAGMMAFLAAAPAAAGSGSTPPPPNSKITIEDATKLIESMPMGTYHDLHARRPAYRNAQLSFQGAIDQRRADYQAPRVRALADYAAATAGAGSPPVVASDQASLEPAAGEPETRALSEAAIREFYAQSTTAHLKPFDIYKTWNETHLHDRVKMIQTVTIKLPGASPMVNTQTLSRREFLDALEESYKAMRGATLRNEVTEIVLNPDSRTAKVKDKSTLAGMSIPVDATKDLRADGTSVCNDEVAFSEEKGVVQVVRSVCTLDLTLSPSQDL